MNSDQIVESLRPFGTVDIFQNDRNRTFSAKANLFMHGMAAEVRSGFGHPTMLSALTALQQNVLAVANVGASVSGRPELAKD